MPHSLDFEVHGVKVAAAPHPERPELDFWLRGLPGEGGKPVWVGSLADPSSDAWPESWAATLPTVEVVQTALPGTGYHRTMVSWHVARAVLEAAAVWILLDSGLIT